MKYPITPEYLQHAPDPIARLYQDLEEFVLRDICRRFAQSGTATGSAIEQIKLLQRQGYSTEEIEKYIKKTLHLTNAEYDDMWASTIERNERYYGDVTSKARLIQETLHLDAMQAEIEAIKRQTLGELVNITQSMGFALRGADGKVTVSPIGVVYQKILDDAAIETWSGAVSYDSAISRAVKRLADSGLQYVDYQSGWHNRVDVAARRAVMTGITQMSAKYSNTYMEELGTDYMEVTAHIGARDVEGPSPWSSHKAWQGKVYSIKSGNKYPSVYEVCGWGEVDGLEGANCRHMHHPFFDGVSERTWTDEQLANIDPPPFEFEGKKYTAYQATQMMRKLETEMRQQKREIVAADAAGLENDSIDHSIRLRRLREYYSKFGEAAGLREQWNHTIINDGKIGTKAKNEPTGRPKVEITQRN